MNCERIVSLDRRLTFWYVPAEKIQGIKLKDLRKNTKMHL